MDTPKHLTPKQAAFCAEYLVDLNATKAAERAGYSKATARQQGTENLAKPVIQEEIARMMAAREKRTETTADMVIRELVKLATIDIADIFREDGTLRPIHEIPADVRRAIAGVEVFEEFEGQGQGRKCIGHTRKVRFWEKTKALELLGKHLGIFKDRVELSGPDGGAIRLERERTDDEMRRFAEMLAEADRKIAPTLPAGSAEKIAEFNRQRAESGLPPRYGG